MAGIAGVRTSDGAGGCDSSPELLADKVKWWADSAEPPAETGGSVGATGGSGEATLEQVAEQVVELVLELVVA